MRSLSSCCRCDILWRTRCLAWAIDDGVLETKTVGACEEEEAVEEVAEVAEVVAELAEIAEEAAEEAAEAAGEAEEAAEAAEEVAEVAEVAEEAAEAAGEEKAAKPRMARSSSESSTQRPAVFEDWEGMGVSVGGAVGSDRGGGATEVVEEGADVGGVGRVAPEEVGVTTDVGVTAGVGATADLFAVSVSTGAAAVAVACGWRAVAAAASEVVEKEVATAARSPCMP